MKLAFIGYGTIVNLALEALTRELPKKLSHLIILCRESGRARALEMSQRHADKIADATTITDSLDELLALSPHITAEAAGHEALKSCGPAILRSGIDLIITSAGALANADLRYALDVSAKNATFDIIPGAVGGLDILAAAKLSGLKKVLYISRKPPAAWRGTAADDMTDLNSLDGETIFFRGNAAEAATRFPQNANVAATIALRGIGFEATDVQLIADPTITCNVHELNVFAQCADFSMRIEGHAAPDNPKTSLTTAYSLAHTIVEKIGQRNC